MRQNKFGLVGYSQLELIDALKVNPKLDLDNVNILCTNPDSYNSSIDELYLDYKKLTKYDDKINIKQDEKEYHLKLQQNWRMPHAYKSIDIESYLLNMCSSKIELDRVTYELALYKKLNLVMLLRYLKYLVDTIYKHNVILGVGRGSSCASYCLYLMKVHRVDSIKYDLDIHEFLREK